MKSNKKIIIHIGGHKTGSTSLQVYLSKNRLMLRDQGVYYPKIEDNKPSVEHGRNQTINGFILQRNYYCPEVLDSILEEYENNNSIHTLILSEENLFYDYLNMHRFHQDALEKLSNHNTHILVCLRRSVEYICGMWQEYVRFKSIRSLDKMIVLGEYEKSLNQLYTLGSRFGNEKIHLEIYNPHDEDNYNVIPQMMSALGIKNIEEFVASEERENIGISRATLDARCFMNQYMNHILTANQCRQYNFILNYGSKQSVLNSLSDQKIKQVCDDFYTQECAIAKTFLGRETLFENRYPKVYQTNRNKYFPEISPFKNSLLRYVMRDIILTTYFKSPNLLNKVYVYIWTSMSVKSMRKLRRVHEKSIKIYVSKNNKKSQLALKILNSIFKPFS